MKKSEHETVYRSNFAFKYVYVTFPSTKFIQRTWSFMKKILFAGAEAMPFAATGGLGDVLGSLPAALAATGEVDVRVVLPLYAAVNEDWRKKMKQEALFFVKLAWREQYCGVRLVEAQNQG